MKKPDSVAVIGAGVAGLWVARSLAARGIEVTMLEAARVGAGSSFGNSGWICPSQAGPLPEPGLIGYGMRSLFDRRSALYISPLSLPTMGPWLLAFARRCNARDYAAGVRALAALGYPSFDLIQQLSDGDGAPALDRSGLVVTAAEPGPVLAFLEAIAPLRETGRDLPDSLLGDDEMAEIEPELVGRAHATFVSDHWQVDPSRLTAYLGERLREDGVKILEGEKVTRIAAAGGGHVIEHSTGSLSADAVVLATGADTARLTAELGWSLPVRGGKGYSIDVADPEWMPRRSMMFMDNHLAMSPMGDRLRIAGTMEFSQAERIDHSRVAAMERSARHVLGSWRQSRPPWMGRRPILPDGLPALGRLPVDGEIFVATGYSMLGVTISPAAGELLARQVAGEDPPELRPFDPARFRGLRALIRG